VQIKRNYVIQNYKAVEITPRFQENEESK